MYKYKVMIEGDNFEIKSDGEVCKCGFFTTRFVEAKDAKNAEVLAMNLIRDELKPIVLNARSNPPMMYIEEIQKIESFGDNIVPGSGFTWFDTEAE